MNLNTEQTLGYYNENASEFIGSTVNIEFSGLQMRFMSMLPEEGRILDLGCGSGRDSLAFMDSGFAVDVVDGSEAMVRAASELMGLSVACVLFEEYEPRHEYDGIWACSSLLHVPIEDLGGIIQKYARSLKPDGVFYMSFKLGNYQGIRNGRWFTDLDEEAFRSLINEVDGLSIDSLDITSDVRPHRENEKWLNAWCIRE